MTGIGLTFLHLNATLSHCQIADNRVAVTESRDIVKPLPSGPNGHRLTQKIIDGKEDCLTVVETHFSSAVLSIQSFYPWQAKKLRGTAFFNNIFRVYSLSARDQNTPFFSSSDTYKVKIQVLIPVRKNFLIKISSICSRGKHPVIEVQVYNQVKL